MPQEHPGLPKIQTACVSAPRPAQGGYATLAVFEPGKGHDGMGATEAAPGGKSMRGLSCRRGGGFFLFSFLPYAGSAAAAALAPFCGSAWRRRLSVAYDPHRRRVHDGNGRRLTARTFAPGRGRAGQEESGRGTAGRRLRRCGRKHVARAANDGYTRFLSTCRSSPPCDESRPVVRSGQGNSRDLAVRRRRSCGGHSETRACAASPT